MPERVTVSNRSEVSAEVIVATGQKRGTTMYRELRALGAAHDVARQVAANSHRWWRNSGKLLNGVLTIAWFDRLGLPRLS
ncbi:hypothetical protein BN2476_210054 [Paraburkholderia piptadeniae]|uniref:Uncharacterized protein n=1 Tax=Paraburkholderia piptadeniae TaxID=1701573 RepID=A0A1N7RVK4_9BURK|nr:hypothetical protein [Paraburkholderia piptadeniae]SIT39126.1 hypothetical protein BN2476_210054 [Paraburkholderia piptadeniae]